MGLTVDLVAFLFAARRAGGLGDVVTLGRQDALVSPRQLRGLLSRFHIAPAADLDRYCGPNRGEALLRDLLGARSVTSLDRSAFEGATLLHDLNTPLPTEHEARFDTVIDGGTLEHVFNVPVALANAMRLVRVGGLLVIFTPANNHCGHGFYQFSPELFFRAFTEANGYRIERLTLASHPYPSVELGRRHRWYDVSDPADLGRRVLLSSRTPAYLMVAARRERAVDPFTVMPLQSDYTARWTESAAGAVQPGPAPRAGLARRAARAVIERVMRWPLVRGQVERLGASLRNRRSFRRVW